MYINPSSTHIQIPAPKRSYFHFWHCQGKPRAGAGDPLWLRIPPNVPNRPLPPPQPHASFLCPLPTLGLLIMLQVGGMSHLHRSTARRSTERGVQQRSRGTHETPYSFQAKPRFQALVTPLAAVEEKEESWSVHPLPTFPCSRPALGPPLDTTRLLVLRGKAFGTESGQRKCGHVECHETEQGLEVRKRERHLLPPSEKP